MLIVLSLLKKFLRTDASLDEIVTKLTEIGLEVEDVVNYVDTHDKFIVAEIVSAEQHPNATNLRKCKVFDGINTLDIVCGALNARSGIKVVLAPISTKIPLNGMIIKETVIRGEKSQGMLCSEEELMLAASSNGIIEINNENAKPGQKYIDIAGLSDPIIDVSITPNKGDCLSIYGIARLLAACGLGELQPLDIPTVNSSFDSPIKVEIIEIDACNRYMGAYIKDVKNIPSPEWFLQDLRKLGIKPISAIVDITNYINLVYGRPLHAFDADKINGSIKIRYAKHGENIQILNGDTKDLKSSNLVIADDSGPLVIAGIMGGMQSACQMDTTNIFLEAANFSQNAIIKSAKGLYLDSDSRYRFERGIDFECISDGLSIAIDMITKICGGKASNIVDEYPMKYMHRYVDFDYNLIHRKIGKFVDAKTFENAMTKLGYELSKKDAETYMLKIPSWRNDVSIAEDILEDLIIVIGYDSIKPLELPKYAGAHRNPYSNEYRTRKAISNILCSKGFNEIINWSFIDEKTYGIFHEESEMIKLENPISTDLAVMRGSLIPGLLKSVSNNEKNSITDLSLFEDGTIFYGTSPDKQHRNISFVRSGKLSRDHYLGQENWSWMHIKQDLFYVLKFFGMHENVRIDLSSPKWYHPGRSGRIMLGKNIIGYFGEINPMVLKNIGIKQNVVGCEIFYNNIPAMKPFKPADSISLISYQPAVRKLSFFVPNENFAGELVSMAKAVDRDLIKSVNIFDYISSDNNPYNVKLEDGHKIVGISFTIQSDSKTLTSEEIDDIYNKIKLKIESTGAKFRDVQ